MKLELKHLAPYLPYELQLTNNKEFTKLTDINIHDVLLYQDEWKPILHPLSDLKNDFEIESENVIPFMDLFEEDKIMMNHFINSKNPTSFNYPLSFWFMLFKMKIDVFGLIENNLAIDINTLSKIEG